MAISGCRTPRNPGDSVRRQQPATSKPVPPIHADRSRINPGCPPKGDPVSRRLLGGPVAETHAGAGSCRMVGADLRARPDLLFVATHFLTVSLRGPLCGPWQSRGAALHTTPAIPSGGGNPPSVAAVIGVYPRLPRHAYSRDSSAVPPSAFLLPPFLFAFILPLLLSLCLCGLYVGAHAVIVGSSRVVSGWWGGRASTSPAARSPIVPWSC